MTTTATRPTFAQNIARQAAQRRAADRILAADTEGNAKISQLCALDHKLQSLCTDPDDYRATKAALFTWVDGKPAPLATLIERLEVAIAEIESTTASYEYQTTDGVYGSDDYQPDLIF
jgi:hypothetical protein